MGKYDPRSMMPIFRLFWHARNEARAMGLTDNGGAIHSATRIADVIASNHVYPNQPRFGQSLKLSAKAEISAAAYDLRERALAEGLAPAKVAAQIEVEHFLPQRAMTIHIGQMVDAGATDEEILDWLTDNYRLVLLTREERRLVDSRNRSKLCSERLAGIAMRKT